MNIETLAGRRCANAWERSFVDLAEQPVIAGRATLPGSDTPMTAVALAYPGSCVTAALPSLVALRAELPLDPASCIQIEHNRRAVSKIISGADDRLLVVVGPCSVHDPDAALHYAQRLAALATDHADDLLIVLRAYLEKPRSQLGWTGLVPDPDLDGSRDLGRGLRVGRDLLRRAVALGLPLAYEFVDPFVAPYLADLITWGAIGARTVSSQPHRQLASALPMPVGMKNATSGDVAAAVDAVRAAAVPHLLPGFSPTGTPAVLASPGNPHCHVVLRGGLTPNYNAASVAAAGDLLHAASLPRQLVVDASHGNSGKDHRRQPLVVADLATQVANGERGLAGVMLESFLEEGRQEITTKPLRYGVSVTDACLGWDDTMRCLDTLAVAVRARRRRD
jgi:3-deoxy-7-phosphoheptulonate synthase